MMISPGAALERDAKIKENNKISDKVTAILPVGIIAVASQVRKKPLNWPDYSFKCFSHATARRTKSRLITVPQN
jgi:hypothetical protein